MTKKQDAVIISKPNDNWVITTEIIINGRHVTPGTELKMQGVRGRFRFIKHVDTGSAQWLDVWGGPKGSEQWRSFYPERVKTVHSKHQTTENLAKAYKLKRKVQLNQNKESNE